jgi:hypothetical protein
MKAAVVFKTVFVMTFAAGLAVAASSASAQAGVAPTLNITSPTASGGPIFFGTFPAVVNIAYTVQMNGGIELKSLSNLDVTINGTSLYGGPQDAFSNAAGSANQCQGVAASAPHACNALDAFNASLTARWEVPAVGEYTIVVSGKHKSETGEDVEVVQVAQLSAEYPAPPAVANAYINAKPRSWITSTQRGCIIKQVAEQHGQYAAYGPKGGPYNVALIQAAVESYASGCPR